MNRYRLIFVIIITIVGFAGFFTYKQNSPQEQSKVQHEYQFNLAVLNKTFKRDLARSINLYKSFEKHFYNAIETPFIMVVPVQDLEYFKNAFTKLSEDKEITKIPNFLTEQEVLGKCSEPDISYDGGYSQQVVKLCFGMLNIARYYISIDSDTYFTKDFNPQILFDEKILKTNGSQMLSKEINSMQKSPLFLIGCVGHVSKCGVGSTCIEDGNAFLNTLIIKDFWGSKKKEIYRFVDGVVYIDSEAIHNMKKVMLSKGYSSFAKLIRIVPFEMQWYGEYILQHGDFRLLNPLFTEVNDPANECFDEDGGKGKYGITLQSMIYNYNNDKPIESRSTTTLIYKRPIHCNK